MIQRFDTNVLCLECKEAIHNPICPVCLSNEIKSWAYHKNLKSLNKLREKIEDYLKKHKHFTGNAIKCVACGKKNVFVCPYCFTEDVYRAMKKLNASKEIMLDFLTLFNYDFEHCGYYKEREILEGEI